LKRLPDNWPKSKSDRAIGFFAQIALEAVHEKSWESYKVPCLSPISQLFEVRLISKNVIRGAITQKALEPIIEEANLSLQSDPAIRKILSQKDLEPSDLTFQPKDTATEHLIHAGFLLRTLTASYRRTCEDLLIAELFAEARRSVVLQISKAYFSHLLTTGHEKAYLEDTIRTVFFADPPEKFNKRVLRNFFARFPPKTIKFKVYGTANEKFLDVAHKMLGLEIISGRSVPRKLAKLDVKKNDELYFCVEEEAHDHYSAGNKVGKRLGIGEALMMLFPGDVPRGFSDELYVKQKGRSEYKEVPSQPKFSRRVLSYSQNALHRHTDRIESLVLRSTGPDSIIGSDFLRSTMTASLADRSTAPEVKLLTLWAAFEALLPLVPEDATNRISYFLTYIVPSVCLSYARENFIEFTRDAMRLHAQPYRDFLNTLPGDKNYVDKLAAIVVKGSSEQKKELCRVFSDNPLALARLKSLEDNFSSAENFEKKVTAHADRVRWQVHRIYRERNTVMHNGETSPFLEHLLSNTYYYYVTTFMNIETVSKSFGGLSVSESLGAIRKLHQSEIEKLKRTRKIEKSDENEARAMILETLAGPFKAQT
jgi:hypothetical protein